MLSRACELGTLFLIFFATTTSAQQPPSVYRFVDQPDVSGVIQNANEQNDPYPRYPLSVDPATRNTPAPQCRALPIPRPLDGDRALIIPEPAAILILLLGIPFFLFRQPKNK